MRIEPLISWETFFISFFVLLIAVRLGAELIVYFYERKARRTRQRQTGGNVPKAVQRYYSKEGA